jgi:3-oxoacyl-[acyl-carrier-protein] synthase-3
MPAVITAIAHHVPSKILGNAELAARLGLTDEWIVKRTGIRERRVSEEGGTSELIVPAASECLERAGIPAAAVDCVIVATITPDHLTPATAVTVIRQLGATKAWGFDLSAACSGFLYGLVTASKLIEGVAARRVLVCGADRMSCITDPDDRRTAVLLADGAGVALLERGDDRDVGLVDQLFRVDARGEQDVIVVAGGSAMPATAETVADRKHCLFISGQPVFRAAVEGLSAITAELMGRHRLTPDDLGWFVPHQANIRILEAVAERLHIPLSKVMINVDRYGNTSAATIPIALSEWSQAGRLRPGDKVVMCSVGAGYTFGAVYLIWGGASPTAGLIRQSRSTASIGRLS